MAIFPKLKVKAPKMAHHDLTHYMRTSMGVGPLVPILVRECVPGDEHYINIESLVNTQALLSPLYGSFRIKIMAFFAGTSLYVPKLWRNGSMIAADGTLDANYPYFTIPPKAVGSEDVLYKVDPSSLLAYLGMPPYYANPIASTASSNPYTDTRFNAIPILMYYDIFRHYFANRQQETAPFGIGFSVDTDSYFLYHQLSKLDDLYLNLPSDGGDVADLLRDATGVVKTAFDKPFGGLCLGTYMPDMMNVILNPTFYEKNVTSVEVDTSGGAFQIDQLVTAKKLWNSRNKDAMSNGTFKDWVRAHYGVTPKIMDDMPTFLGASSSDIAFEDIRATTTQQIGDDTQYLGDKSSSGLGYGNTRTIRCTADRPGYLMVLAQIVPYVDYYQRMERYMLHTKLSDSFRPEYNGVGLQDVLISDLSASAEHLDSPRGTPMKTPWSQGLGKQPAYIEYMTAVNKLRGTFCSTEKSWVLARDLNGNVPMQTADTNAYIEPNDWNQPFAVQSPTAQNFLVQFKINHKVRSTVLKRLLPKF